MNVLEFFDKMDSDLAEAHEMDDADLNLSEAIERFEKAYQLKLKVTYDTKTNG